MQDVVNALPLILTIIGTMGGVAVAFARHDKDAMSRLMGAIGEIYLAVEQERRRSLGASTTEPMSSALQKAAAIRGRPLRATEEARVRIALQAEHERRRMRHV